MGKGLATRMEAEVKARAKWHIRLAIVKGFPDGHEEHGVATLYPERGNELNPVFFVDGEYYYWGEPMGRDSTGVYRPSIKRVGYGHMTATILSKKERRVALKGGTPRLRIRKSTRALISRQKPVNSGAGGTPGRGKGSYPPITGLDASCNDGPEASYG